MLRSVAKAVIIRNDKILMQKCTDIDGIVYYYELPGGGQEPLETMEDAVIRTCREETGYSLAVERLLAVQEEIMVNPVVREAYPGYEHRIFHIFLCHILRDVDRVTPRERELFELGLEWVPIAQTAEVAVRPQIIQYQLPELLASGRIGYMHANRTETFFPQEQK